MVATPEFLATLPGEELVARLPRPPLVATSQVLETIADADSPRGLIAICDLPRGGLASIHPQADGIWLYLDHVQDPGNLGALARVAEGLGAAGLLLSPGCADPNHPRALRASAGSLLRIAVAVGAEARAAKEHLARPGTRWIGLEAHGGATRLGDLEPSPAGRATVLALGAEGPGLSARTRALLDEAVTIPLRGRLESLNVVVAAALVLARLSGTLSPP